MQTRPSERSVIGQAASQVLRAAVLLLPAAVIAVGGAVNDGPNRWMYWAGSGLVGFLGLALVPQARIGTPTKAMAVIAEYILAQAWLWSSGGGYHAHWYPHLALGLLLGIPAMLFSAATLVRTGAHDLRRARTILARLRRRTAWPDDIGLIQSLPEVSTLRDALASDAAPALAVLGEPGVHMQVAALSALAYRRAWRTGQPELVLQAAQVSTEPAVRVAAITALVHSSDRFLLEALVGFLSDPSPAVRTAAAEAAVADGGRHWSTLRFAVHDALGNARHKSDGAFPLPAGAVPAAVVNDFFAWAGEGGYVARRATQTLVDYYAQLLNSRGDAESLAAEILKTVLDRSAPPGLRVELATMMHEQSMLPADAFESLVAADQPVALRLLAADALLADGVHAAAERALREIARLPNRELTLTVAQIVQRRLAVDLGLNLQRLPAVQSRHAAEVSRQVMQWASEAEPTGELVPATAAATSAGMRPRSAAIESDWDLGPFPDPNPAPRGGPGSGVTRW